MPFDWREVADRPLIDRYGDDVLGFAAWLWLLEQLQDFRTASPERAVAVLEGFLDQLPGRPARPRPPRVFVSHQRDDVKWAERIAYLSVDEGMDYWLDVHDPILIYANQTIDSDDPRFPIIIAAIIEIALLNSSHLIATQTKLSLGSKWVPYELGRARDRHLFAQNTGGWFHPDVQPSAFGDYVHLCLQARGGEQQLRAWFKTWVAPKLASGNWSRPMPRPLP